MGKWTVAVTAWQSRNCPQTAEGHAMKTLKTLKRELLADDETRAAYDALAGEFSVAKTLIAARARAGLSQANPILANHRPLRRRRGWPGGVED
jgi:hypothetical protein